jgi:hypothetical protein
MRSGRKIFEQDFGLTLHTRRATLFRLDHEYPPLFLASHLADRLTTYADMGAACLHR